MHYGFRARDESTKLCWGDIQLEVDADSGREMLVWKNERGSKTRTGLEGGRCRSFNPKIFATGTNKCPILYYKKFASHRPQKSNAPESPFFLAINHQSWQQSGIWYKNAPLGKSEIGKLLRVAATEAGLTTANSTRKVSNHSVRKTSISRLLDANVPENFVAQLSGLKNLQSLSNYKSASITHQRIMSDTLSRQQNVSYTQSQQSLFQSRCEMSSTSTSTQSPSLFPGATIGSINNCVFNMIPLPAASLFQPVQSNESHEVELPAPKQPRIEASNGANITPELEY